jgi:hypothetical protein
LDRVCAYQSGGHGHGQLVPTETVAFSFSKAQTTFFTGGGKGQAIHKYSLNITPISSG